MTARHQSEQTGRTWASNPGLYLQVHSMSACWYHWNSKFWPQTGSGIAFVTWLEIHNFCWKVISHISTSDHNSSLNSAKRMGLGNNESSWKYLSNSGIVGLHIDGSKSSGKPQNSGFFFFLYGKKQITMLCHFKSLIARWCVTQKDDWVGLIRIGWYLEVLRGLWKSEKVKKMA